MLAQILVELAKIERWLAGKTPPHMEDHPYSVAWATIAPVVYAAAESERAFVDFMVSGHGSAEPNAMDDTLNHLADTALMALEAMQHITGNESQVGAVLLSRLRSMEQRMHNDLMAQARNKVRQSREAQRAQQAWQDANIN